MKTNISKIQEKFSPKNLTWAAITLWLLSFVLYPALILYNGDKLSGLSLMLIGWLGPLFMQFSWYANVFFVYGAYVQLTGKRAALKSSFIATLLIIDSFRYKEMLLDEGGGTSPIYGYGPGYICWVSAIFLLLLSSGIKGYNLDKVENQSRHNNWDIRKISSVPLISFVVLVVFSSLNLVINGSSHEKKFSKSNIVIYKKNRVCGKEVPNSKSKFKVDTNSPLEVVTDRNVWELSPPSQLLNWGIPKVRMNNFDYFNTYHKTKHTMAARAKMGGSSAVLKVTKKGKWPNSRVITIELTSSDERSESFKQHWTEEVPGKSYMCPEYSIGSEREEQPRKIIMDSLLIDRIITAKEISNNYKTFNGELLSEEIYNENLGDVLNNFQCPNNIGFVDGGFWEEITKNDSVASKLNLPFKIDETYYFQSVNLSNFMCSGDYIYLYKFGRNGKSDENLYLRISKRESSAFGEEWFRTVQINEIGKRIVAKNPTIISIEENRSIMVIELLDNETGKKIKIKSKLSTRKG